MLPHVTILYRTICAQAERPLVLVKGTGQVNALVDAVAGLVSDLGWKHHRRRDSIETDHGHHIRFANGDEADMLCGVCGDILFARLSEWTEHERQCILQPFLVGRWSRQGMHRIERDLIQRGVMTVEDRYYPSVHIDDILVNLDSPLLPHA